VGFTWCTTGTWCVCVCVCVCVSVCACVCVPVYVFERAIRGVQLGARAVRGVCMCVCTRDSIPSFTISTFCV